MRRLTHVLAFFLILAALPQNPALAVVSRSQEIRARVFRLLTDGIQAYKEGRPKDAIPMLEEAAEIALNSFRAYYYLGLAYRADHQYRRAIEPLEIALELDPVNLQARVALGDCLLALGDPGEALAEYHRALALQEDYAPAWDGIGRAEEASGNAEKAIQHFRKAIQLNPGFPDASMNLGDLYMREGRHAEATRLFLDAIRVRPDFASAYNRLGVAYARRRMANEAIAALRHAESLEKGNPWHPVTIGGIFLDLDNVVQAEREFDKALRMDPDYLEAYLARARLLRRQGSLDDAIGFLDVGLGRDVENPVVRDRLLEFRDRIVAEQDRLARLERALVAGEAGAGSEGDGGSGTTDDPGGGTTPDAAAGEAEMPEGRDLLVAVAALRQAQGDHAAAAALLKRAASEEIPPAAGSPPAGEAGAPPEMPAAPAALAPDDPDILRQLAYNALRAGLFGEAEDACRRILAVAPGDADTWINLALAHLGQAEHADAESALQEAIRLRPGDARPLAYLGNVQVLRDRPEDAIRSLDASLKLMPQEDADRPRVERLLEALRNGAAGTP